MRSFEIPVCQRAGLLDHGQREDNLWKMTDRALPNLPRMLAAPFQYFAGRKGMLTTNYVEAGGFAKTKYADGIPDIQFHFVPGYRSHRGRLVEYGHGYAIHTCVLRPKSGWRSTERQAAPRGPERGRFGR
jgi:choline dehydrogenase-like flavoprotein